MVAALTSGRVSYVDYATHQQHSSGILSGGLILNASWNVNTSKIICSDEYGELIVLEAESLAMNRHWLAHKSKYGLVSFMLIIFCYTKLKQIIYFTNVIHKCSIFEWSGSL